MAGVAKLLIETGSIYIQCCVTGLFLFYFKNLSLERYVGTAIKNKGASELLFYKNYAGNVSESVHT